MVMAVDRIVKQGLDHRLRRLVPQVGRRVDVSEGAVQGKGSLSPVAGVKVDPLAVPFVG